jgi:hypothetical protein
MSNNITGISHDITDIKHMRFYDATHHIKPDATPMNVATMHRHYWRRTWRHWCLSMMGCYTLNQMWQPWMLLCHIDITDVAHDVTDAKHIPFYVATHKITRDVAPDMTSCVRDVARFYNPIQFQANLQCYLKSSFPKRIMSQIQHCVYLTPSDCILAVFYRIKPNFMLIGQVDKFWVSNAFHLKFWLSFSFFSIQQ